MQSYVVFFSLFQESLACIGLLAGGGGFGELTPPAFPSYPAPSFPAPSFPSPSFPSFPSPSFPSFPASAPSFPSFPQPSLPAFPQPVQMFPQGPIVGGQNFPGGQFGSFQGMMAGLQGPVPPQPPQPNFQPQFPQPSIPETNFQTENLPQPRDWCYSLAGDDVGPAGGQNSCFLNSHGFQCCHRELNALLDDMVTTTSYVERWRGCNIQRMANDIQRNTESRFNMRFETLVGSDNICGRHNYVGDWMCKVITVYAHPAANGLSSSDSASGQYVQPNDSSQGAQYPIAQNGSSYAQPVASSYSLPSNI